MLVHMFRYTFQFLLCALATTASAFAGKIIVDNDEWTLSNSGFASAGYANATAYAQNAAQFLTGGPAGGTTKIWIDSSNFGLNGSDLRTALGAYNLTDAGFSTFTLFNLQSYQAVFLSGDNLTAGEESALVNYVRGGGSVYVAAGTGVISGGAAGEAAQWNAFLNPFSLDLATSYNGINGALAITGASPIFAGVSQLYYIHGNPVRATGLGAQIITSDPSGAGLIGTYSASTAPEPSTILLAAGALAVLGFRKAKRQACARKPLGIGRDCGAIASKSTPLL